MSIFNLRYIIHSKLTKKCIYRKKFICQRLGTLTQNPIYLGKNIHNILLKFFLSFSENCIKMYYFKFNELRLAPV